MQVKIKKEEEKNEDEKVGQEGRRKDMKKGCQLIMECQNVNSINIRKIKPVI